MRTTFLRFGLLALLLCAALATLAYLPLRAWVGPAALGAVLLASAVALLGALAGHGAGALVPRRGPEAPAAAAFLATGVRLLVTTVLAFVAVRAFETPAPAFALVVGGQYLALLVLEVSAAAAEVGAAGRTPEPPGGGAAS